MQTVRLLTVLALLLAVPVAAAQTPTTALEIVGGPATDVNSTRGTALVALNVTLRVSNVVCTSSSTFAVDLVASSERRMNESDEDGINGNATVHVTPVSLNFPIGAGPYGSNPGFPAAQPYTATQSISVAVESAGLPNETVYDIAVAATLRPASASGCRGTAAVPEATSSTTFVVRFNETADVLPTSPQLPTPWFLAPLAGALAVVSLRRRRA